VPDNGWIEIDHCLRSHSQINDSQNSGSYWNKVDINQGFSFHLCLLRCLWFLSQSVLLRLKS